LPFCGRRDSGVIDITHQARDIAQDESGQIQTVTPWRSAEVRRCFGAKVVFPGSVVVARDSQVQRVANVSTSLDYVVAFRLGPIVHKLDLLLAFRQWAIAASGTKAVADDSYIRESILSPAAKVVKGYKPVMFARLAAQSKSRPDVSLSRALLVAASIGFWMLAVSAKLVFLQVSQHEGLVDRARNQQQNAIETGAQRGELLDRQGRELARSVQTESLFVDPGTLSVGELECTAESLSAALGLSYSDLAKELRDAQQANKRFLWIARRVDAERANKILAMNLPGLQSRQTSSLQPRHWAKRRW